MNIDLDLNPADFHAYDGFEFCKFCLTEFGLVLFCVISLDYCICSASLFEWSFSHPSKLYIMFVFGATLQRPREP